MRPRITYSKYERRRLGNKSGEFAKIAAMFRRSFGSGTFAGFWRYWNPLFSYYLLYNCYSPLRKYLPRYIAVMLTFMASGAIHDLFASLALLKLSVFFTPIFAGLGSLTILEEVSGLNFEWASYPLRYFINGALITGVFYLGISIGSLSG